MVLEPMDVPWYVEEYFEEDFETLVVGGMVFGTLIYGVFDFLDILYNFKGIIPRIFK